MRYADALEYIEGISAGKGIVPGLNSIRELCRRLGDPQDKLKFIHIAGTNGKGSTLAFISSILMQSGYRVGRYISPTITDYRERFQINGKMISQSMFATILEEVKNACDIMTEEGLDHPTAFEIETAVSFLYFLRKNCDIVVLETGMGGRDDATNIVSTTVLSVLTTISMDHMQFLGDTLSKITENKCGIIKIGVPVVSAAQNDEVLTVINRFSEKNNSSLKVINSGAVSDIKYGLNKQSFKLDKERYEIRLSGVWQIENAALAVTAANILNDNGYKMITKETIKKGLYNTYWPARFQVVRKKPLLIIDGAHNEDAAVRLRQSIDTYIPEKKKIYIMGMFRDKEVDKVISMIVKDAVMVFTCQTPNNPRAMKPLELAEHVREYNPNVTSCDSVDEAVEFAISMADDETAVIACGSLAYLGRILDIYKVL